MLNTKKYLLLFDDLQIENDDFYKLLPYLLHYKSIKIIATCQTAYIENIQKSIMNRHLSTKAKYIKLATWGNDDLKKLLRSVTGLKTVNREESIVRIYNNPFLIVWIGMKNV